jgi:menaquinol-cytochrome c reductase iron-sulfur subunit
MKGTRKDRENQDVLISKENSFNCFQVGGEIMNLNDSASGRQTGMMRRSFFQKLAFGALAFLGSLAIGIPLIGTLIGPSFMKKRSPWAKIKGVDSLVPGQPREISFTDNKVDAFIRETVVRNVWIIKHTSSDITVFSPICPHLGCRYHWNPKDRHFECPCHGSVFSSDGKAISGPSPRPLDTLPQKIVNGELYVKWELFKLGIPQKTRV